VSEGSQGQKTLDLRAITKVSRPLKQPAEHADPVPMTPTDTKIIRQEALAELIRKNPIEVYRAVTEQERVAAQLRAAGMIVR
jgi:hypothetical protein